ncbi:response regulator transcription factor [Asticcacaulis solisilvae]|uniref:response regulator transcription factor n=1 Tax=Asticcacaulis solisilvae TaxID=1217274 RepID=UPI003FD7E465
MTAQQAPARVLVVEDETDIRELLEIVLMSRGYKVATAENGRVGLEVMARFAPQLILLDLAMPELDGLGFLDAKRQVPDARDIPVIVLSARDKNTDGVTAVEMGASAFITKPFDTGVVLAKVGALLADARSTAE